MGIVTHLYGLCSATENYQRNKMKLCSFLLPLVIADDAHPVFFAIRDQQLDKALDIAKGMTDINIKGPGGQTPLMMSVLGGHYHLVKELLAMDADATIPEKDGFGPMHGAGFQGRAEIVQMLINHGLDKSDRHGDGFTPMLRACWGTEMRHTETGHSNLHQKRRRTDGSKSRWENVHGHH